MANNARVTILTVCMPLSDDATMGLLGTECVPMVQKFGELKEQLRKNGELVPFLRDMRKEFQRLAMSE